LYTYIRNMHAKFKHEIDALTRVIVVLNYSMKGEPRNRIK
jgi:hypothetical protein